MRAIRSEVDHLLHHHAKGATTMSKVDTLKQFIDEHAPELETLLADAEHAAEAIDPALAPVLPLFGELADGAKALVADTIRALHNVPAPATPVDPTTPEPAPAPDPAPLSAAEQARLDALQARAGGSGQ